VEDCVSQQLMIRYVGRGGLQSLVVTGEVDMCTAPELFGEARSLLSCGATGMLIDLEGVSFMDPAGLRALLRIEKLCEMDGCTLYLTRGSEQVQRFFELAGVPNRFRVVDLPKLSGGFAA
jgi:anti-sigma B factor antagonist